MQKIVRNNFKSLNGQIAVPADKSVSHRAMIFAALANGKSVIKNFSDGQDPHSTVEVCGKLGAEIIQNGSEITVVSDGKLRSYADNIYCGNSGTTMRLMTGVLAGQNFDSVLTGDESLSKRPMKRIIEPLTMMGAKIQSDDNRAPIRISGQELVGIDYVSKLASAQVKSCILLAGLFANGVTKYTEPHLSRNHTEIMLKAMGADIVVEDLTTSIKKSKLYPIMIEVPGDISSAAFFIVSALIVPDSKILIKNVGLNPTRTGIIDVVEKMGAQIRIVNKKEVCGEVIGDIEVEYSELKGCEISGDIIPRLIDEIPVIAVLATQADGQTVIKDAQDLRNKESDRISAVVAELRKLGADIEETSDGMIINGKTELSGGVEVDTYNDHRLAMSLYVAGLICKKEILINDFEWVNISFPTFENLMEKIKR